MQTIATLATCAAGGFWVASVIAIFADVDPAKLVVGLTFGCFSALIAIALALLGGR